MCPPLPRKAHPNAMFHEPALSVARGSRHALSQQLYAMKFEGTAGEGFEETLRCGMRWLTEDRSFCKALDVTSGAEIGEPTCAKDSSCGPELCGCSSLVCRAQNPCSYVPSSALGSRKGVWLATVPLPNQRELKLRARVR